MTSDFYHRPALPLLFSLIVGILLGRSVSGHFFGGLIVFFVAFGATGYGFIRHSTIKYAPLIVFSALGYLLIQHWAAPALPSNHIIHYTDTDSFQITGRIVSPPFRTKQRTTFILQTESLAGNERLYFVKGNIRVSVWEGSLRLQQGDRIRFKSRIRSIRNFGNPGRFDYERYLHDQKIWGSAHTNAGRLKQLQPLSVPFADSHVDAARHKIAALIGEIPDPNAAGVLKALIIGDRRHIPVPVREAFNRSGAGHLLAISGLHIGIVASVAFFIFRWLFSQNTFLLSHAWTRKAAAILSLCPVIAYGLLAGMSPSTQRAVIMVAIFLLTFLVQRETDGFNTLGIAALVILIVHPPALLSISFQLSFAAVFFILMGLSWTGRRNIPGPNLYPPLKRLVCFVLISAFAILGTLPLTMAYFNQVSVVGLAANLLLVPLIGFLVVPMGLFAVLIYPLTATGALWGMTVSAFFLSKALLLIHYFSDLPWASLKTITPSWLEIACYYIAWSCLLTMIRHEPAIVSSKPEHKASSSVFRIKKQPAVLLGLTLSILTADIGFWTYQRYWRSDLRITAIDVGQGTAALLEFPFGHTMLIDGGGFSDNSSFDMGQRVLAPFLWRKKIKTIDTMALSHPNSDHLNGLVYIAENFKVKQVWTNSEVVDTKGFRDFKAAVHKNRIDAPCYPSIARDHIINGVKLKILYPPDDFLVRNKTWRNTNNNSLVIQLQLGSKRVLLPGDIMKKAEAELLVMAGKSLQSTVLFAPHHGSKTSSSDRFLKTVDPEVVIISTGWQNRFNLPHPAILKKYETNGYRVLRTDLNGAIELRTDGRDLSIKPFKP